MHTQISSNLAKTELLAMAQTHINLPHSEVKAWSKHTEIKVTNCRTFKPLDLGGNHAHL